MRIFVVTIFTILFAVNAWAIPEMKLTCKAKPPSTSISKSKPTSCKLPNSTSTEKNQESLKAVADACKENVSGLTDDFVRSYTKVFGNGGAGTMAPEILKQYIEQQKQYLENNKVIIKRFEQALDEFDLEETQEKRKNFIEKIKEFKEKENKVHDQLKKAKDTDEQSKLNAELAKVWKESQKFYSEGSIFSFTKEQLEISIKKYASAIKNAEDSIAENEAQLEKLTKPNQNHDSEVMAKDRAYVEELITARLMKIKGHSRFVDCGLTDVELFAIASYTGSGYFNLNGALRRDDKSEIQKFQFLIDALNSGLSKLGAYKNTVRRGTDMEAEALKEYCEGCIVKMKAFTSTSRASGFPGAQKFIIQSKTGAYIDPISAMAGEEEVLFKPGVKFKVLKVKGNEYTLKEVP